MTGRKILFYSLEESVNHKVKLGDDMEVEVLGKGSVLVKMVGGVQKLIHDIKYVPSLAHNLLSIGQLISSGYKVVFSKNVCRIF